MYSKYLTLSNQSKTVQQRGVELHSAVKYRRSGDHCCVGSDGDAASTLYLMEKTFLSSHMLVQVVQLMCGFEEITYFPDYY